LCYEISDQVEQFPRLDLHTGTTCGFSDAEPVPNSISEKNQTENETQHILKSGKITGFTRTLLMESMMEPNCSTLRVHVSGKFRCIW
jgi:hypothetical protein